MDETLALQLLHLLGIEAHSILEKPELKEDGGYRIYYDIYTMGEGHWRERFIDLYQDSSGNWCQK